MVSRILIAGCVAAGLGGILDASEDSGAGGGRLHVLMEVAGGTLSLEASGFREGAGDGGERRFVPTRVEATFRGRQEASHEVRGTSGETLSRHETRVRLDGEWEAVRETAATGIGDWLTVRVGPKPPGGEPPLIDIEAVSPPEGAGGGFWQVTRRNASVREETTRLRLLRDGVPVDGAPAIRSEVHVPGFRIRIGSGREGSPVRHTRTGGPGFAFEDEELRPVRVATERRLVAGGRIEAVSRADEAPDIAGGFGELPVSIQWEFVFGDPPDVGWFEVADAGEEQEPWRPSWGGHRDLVIRLTRPEEVEGVRVRLERVSAHPGLAVNTRASALLRPEGWSDLREAVPVSFQRGAVVLEWERRHVVPAPHPADEAPDLHFALGDHPSFVARDPGEGEHVSRMSTDRVEREIPLRVRCADWAARGEVAVEVRVEGVWDALLAKGPGADAATLRVVLPEGADEDGVPAGFHEEFDSGDDPDGDGLTVAEEYRGIVVDGKHRRLSPEKREVFVLDPLRCVGEEERIATGRRFAPWNVELVFLGEGEHAGERVGERVRVIVIEPVRANLWPWILRFDDPEEQRQAFRAARPAPGCETVFVDVMINPAALAEDLARILGLEEFGSQS